MSTRNPDEAEPAGNHLIQFQRNTVDVFGCRVTKLNCCGSVVGHWAGSHKNVSSSSLSEERHVLCCWSIMPDSPSSLAAFMNSPGKHLVIFQILSQVTYKSSSLFSSQRMGLLVLNAGCVRVCKLQSGNNASPITDSQSSDSGGARRDKVNVSVSVCVVRPQGQYQLEVGGLDSAERRLKTCTVTFREKRERDDWVKCLEATKVWELESSEPSTPVHPTGPAVSAGMAV